MSEAQTEEVTAEQAKPKRGGFKTIVYFICITVMALIEIPTTFILMVGMLPTVIAVLIDKDPNQTAGYTVGALNFSGVVPVVVLLWQGSNSYGFAVELLKNSMVWLVMYGAAAIGWGFYFIIPQVVAAAYTKKTEFQIRRLEKERNELMKAWSMPVDPKVN